ncbi:MAG TPA: LLM class F420-dependent oxidoreductase [Gaiellaceae bacterium]|nr:LLM class F420-dependent oxidoreductase [Gaiellaceae bacterium]
MTELGRIGVWLGPLSLRSAAETRELAPELEELGYSALWFGEGVGTKECFSQAATLLGWTRRAVVASGIANLYARDPMAMANGARTLADAYPGRLLLGIGVSHAPSVAARGHDYGRPLATMRAYLDAMDEAAYRAVPPAEPPDRVLAALGPRMLRLAAERTRGAHPYFTPPEHTRSAREVLGPGPLLAPEQAFLLDSDPASARAKAREHTVFYLELDNYRRNLLRLGFTEDDFHGGGSDRLVDAIVAWGDVDAVRERVRAHLDAGADHVCVQAIGVDPLDELRQAAPALAGL